LVAGQQSIAFEAPGKLQRTDLAGGPPVPICDAAEARGPAWNSNGQIVFGSLAGGLFQVPELGGTPSPLTHVDTSRGGIGHRFPQILPGGRFLYWAQADRPENTGVYVAAFAKPAERVFLLQTETAAIVALGGDGRDYLLWLRGGTLLAQELDTGPLKLRGEAHAIAGPISSTGGIGAMAVSASGDGLALYLLRARILGSHEKIHRDRGRQVSLVCRIEKLRNSEVEQFDRSIGRNQDVAGLQIAMYHQALVRVLNCGANATEQFKALADIQFAFVTPAVNRLAIDQLHDKVRQPLFGTAAVEEPRNIGMIERCQDLALAAKRSRISLLFFSARTILMATCLRYVPSERSAR
jgi:hypothetical protein